MESIQYFKIFSPYEKLVDDLQENGCFVCSDISYKYVYMRNPRNIGHAITFNPSVFNNMVEDFDEETNDELSFCINSDVELTQNIIEEQKKGAYVDLTCRCRKLIFQAPYDLNSASDPVFISLTYHSFACANHKARDLTTIHFTTCNENLGEVNTSIDHNSDTLRKLFEDLNVSIKFAAIKQPITDYYVMYKYGDNPKEGSFELI